MIHITLRRWLRFRHAIINRFSTIRFLSTFRDFFATITPFASLFHYRWFSFRLLPSSPSSLRLLLSSSLMIISFFHADVYFLSSFSAAFLSNFSDFLIAAFAFAASSSPIIAAFFHSITFATMPFHFRFSSLIFLFAFWCFADLSAASCWCRFLSAAWCLFLHFLIIFDDYFFIFAFLCDWCFSFDVSLFISPWLRFIIFFAESFQVFILRHARWFRFHCWYLLNIIFSFSLPDIDTLLFYFLFTD